MALDMTTYSSGGNRGQAGRGRGTGVWGPVRTPTTTATVPAWRSRYENVAKTLATPTNLDPSSKEYQDWLKSHWEASQYVKTGKTVPSAGMENVILGGLPRATPYAYTINPKAGSTLPALTPKMARDYQTQLANLQSQETMGLAEQRAARIQALMQASAARREALRRATGQAMDVGAAMAESGVSSPGLVGVTMDQLNAQAAAGLGEAAGMRTSGLENYLRNVASLLSSGRMARRELDDWRARQLAEIARQDALAQAAAAPIVGGI